MTPARKRRSSKTALTAARVRDLVSELPETTESAHMGHPDFRVRNKIFAALTTDELRVNVKIDPANLDALLRSTPGLFRDVWAGRWIGMDIDSVNENVLRDLLEDAWLLTAPRALAKSYANLKQTD